MQNSPLAELPAPLAIVCHDAGAANIVFAWMRDFIARLPAAASNWRVFLGGPARRLWMENDGGWTGQCCSSLEEALDGAASVLTGTGWASDLEHDARRLANIAAVPSAAVIDHWVNYQMRFERAGQVVLPGQILVTDPYAEAEAKRQFPDVPVHQYPNLYLQETAARVAPVPDIGGDVLYVLEPIHDDWGRAQSGEFQALDYFAENFSAVVPLAGLRVRLRPHPSELPGKYQRWIDEHAALDVSIDDSRTLEASLGRARYVVGAETFAMVVALAAGRTVLSTLPPWAHRCRLPHDGIRHLRDMTATPQRDER